MPYIKNIDLTHRVFGFSASCPLKYFINLTTANMTHILDMIEQNIDNVGSLRMDSCNGP